MNPVQGGEGIPDSARAEVLVTGKSDCGRLRGIDRLQADERGARLRGRMAEVQSAGQASQPRSAHASAGEALGSRAVGLSPRRPARKALRRKPFLALRGPRGVGKTELSGNILGSSRALDWNGAARGTVPDRRPRDGRHHRLGHSGRTSAELCLAKK